MLEVRRTALERFLIHPSSIEYEPLKVKVVQQRKQARGRNQETSRGPTVPRPGREEVKPVGMEDAKG